MPKPPTNTASIAAAFAELSAEGVAISVRALRERAHVSTKAASDWLAANRPSREAPPAPTEVFSGMVDTLWSAALIAARDEDADARNAERTELLAAERSALDDADTATTERDAAAARADHAEAEVATLRAQVDDLRRQLDAEAARSRDALAEAAAARQAAHASEVALAEAQATARAFREVIADRDKAAAQATADTETADK